MKSDLRLIAPASLRAFSTLQSAAFNAACLTIATDALTSRNTGYPHMVEDVLSVLDCCARGLSSEPSQQLVTDIQSAVRQGQRLKDTEVHKEMRWPYGAVNSAHLHEDHMPLRTALACLEATRRNAFETMTCVIACLKTNAVYQCDGDPCGAVNIEIEDTMSAAIPAIRRAFCYVKDRAPKSPETTSLFPRTFLSEIETYQKTSVAEDDLLSLGDGELHRSSGSATIPQRKRPTMLPEMQAGFSYQVFISFKNLGPSGKPTEDACMAEELYRFLSEKGFAVFFSNLSLENLGQSAYSKAIDQALDSSQILVAVSTNPEYLESDWVRYEWDRFFNDIISGIKPNGRVFSFVKGVDTRCLPRKLRQYQVFHADRSERDTLCNFIRNALI